MLAAAVLVSLVMQRLRFSPIIGYLLAGLLIGPSGFGFIQNIAASQLLADLGVVFLLFAIGLELPLERLRIMRHLVFGFGGASMLILMGVFGGIVIYSRGSLAEAIIIAGALAFSSTAMLVQLLSERGEFSTRHGRASFSAALFQDLAVVPLLVVIPLLGQKGAVIVGSLVWAGIKAVAALIVIMYAGQKILRPIYRVVVAQKNHELFTAMTLLVILSIGFATYHFGLSMALGAFLAGVMLSETEFRHQIAADIEPFRGLLLGLFFMTVGMMIDSSLVAANFALILKLLAALVFVKLAVFYTVGLYFGLSKQKSLKTAILLAQGGEFAFVLFGVARQSGLMPEGHMNILSMAVILSMVITPILLRLTWPHLTQEMPKNSEDLAAADVFKDKQNHIVICGFGRVGEVIAGMCEAQKIPYIVIDDDHNRTTQARVQDLPVFYGDATKAHVLRSVGIDAARAVVVAASESKIATKMVHVIRENWPHVPVFGRARDSEHAKQLIEAGVTATVPITLNASLELGKTLLQNLGLDNDEIDVTANLVRFNQQGF